MFVGGILPCQHPLFVMSRMARPVLHIILIGSAQPPVYMHTPLLVNDYDMISGSLCLSLMGQ